MGDGESRGPEPGEDLKAGRFRSDDELAEAGRRLQFDGFVTRDFRP